MFYRGISILTGMARNEAMPSPRAPGALSVWAEDAARRAMQQEIGHMPLSERLRDPAAYAAMQRGRRDALEALIRATPDEGRLERAIDLICAICEESCWSENAARVPFEDDGRPDIDAQCAETAVLLGWTERALGSLLSSRVAGKMLYEVRRRVFAPFLAHQDYPFMRARGPRPASILVDIILTALLMESNAQRRAAILKQGLRQLDQAIAARADRAEALEEAAAEIGAITDLAVLLRQLTHGQLDLTPIYPTPDMLDQLLYPQLSGAYFADPVAGTMLPRLSGETLFRIGYSANDEALTALGASLHRARRIPSDSVTGRLMDMDCRQALDAEARPVPRIKCAATPRNRVMVSRFAGMVCCMHAGGQRANAGGVMLFADSAPVLVEAEGLCSLPLIGGHAQMDAPNFDCEAEYDLRKDRDAMSIELTQAYAPGLAHSYQRTALIRRADAVLRIVDAFDLSVPTALSFRFITPQPPEQTPGGLRLGGIELTWEGDLSLRVAPLEARFQTPNGEALPLYRIELTTPAPVTRAFFSFSFAKS